MAPDINQNKGMTFIMLAALLLQAAVLFSLAGCKEPGHPSPQCADAIGCLNIKAGEPFQIGVLQALSGEAATLGTEQIRGIELAITARKGKLLGRDIVVQKADTGCTAEGGANGALKLSSNPEMVAVIGTTCSVAAAAASKILSGSGIVMISGNNSAPFLTSIGGRRAPNWREGFFRTANNDENAGKAAAEYAIEQLGAKKGAAINDGDIYTRGLTDGFEAEFKKLGGDVVLSATVNKGDEDMTPVLEAVNYSGADVLFFPLFPDEGKRVLIQARETPGLENVVMMSDGALIEATFIESVKEKGTGMYFVGPAKPETEACRALEEKYIRQYDTLPLTSYYLTAYDAADLLFTVIEQTAVKTPDGGLHIGRKALMRALYAVENYEGVSGTLNCDEFGDCSTSRFNILRLDDPSKGLPGLESNVVYTYPPKRKDE